MESGRLLFSPFAAAPRPSFGFSLGRGRVIVKLEYNNEGRGMRESKTKGRHGGLPFSDYFEKRAFMRS